MSKINSPVAQQWVEVLEKEKWDDEIQSAADYARYTRLPRWWKWVYDLERLPHSAKILEVGCGSGAQLIPLAARGFQTTGIDVSPDALERFRKILAGLNKFRSEPLPVTLQGGDFAQVQPIPEFAIVFSFGVIEHFLNRDERLEFLRQKFRWTAPGGVCISCVPNGRHPLRQLMREKKLGGYNIPEIDYSVETMCQDMRDAGFVNPRVVPWEPFGYRLVLTPPRTATWKSYRALNLLFKVIPQNLLPLSFRERHAYILSSVADKPSP